MVLLFGPGPGCFGYGISVLKAKRLAFLHTVRFVLIVEYYRFIRWN